MSWGTSPGRSLAHCHLQVARLFPGLAPRGRPRVVSNVDGGADLRSNHPWSEFPSPREPAPTASEESCIPRIRWPTSALGVPEVTNSPRRVARMSVPLISNDLRRRSARGARPARIVLPRAVTAGVTLWRTLGDSNALAAKDFTRCYRPGNRVTAKRLVPHPSTAMSTCGERPRERPPGGATKNGRLVAARAVHRKRTAQACGSSRPSRLSRA